MEWLKKCFFLVSRYGLLGASGCGKTTLLSCLVGRRRLNSGEIWVLGGKPGTKGSGVPGKQVGYMPQEIALYGEFTIRETMMYFGWIFGMCTAEIVERLRFLLQFLDLPSQNRMVKNLRWAAIENFSISSHYLLLLNSFHFSEIFFGVLPFQNKSFLIFCSRLNNKSVFGYKINKSIEI